MARIVVTGSSGLVGRRLIAEVESAGGQVHRLVRSASDQPRSFAWDPMGGTVDATAFAGCDAVVHLAGEGIADKRWNDAQMQKIRDSRVIGTRTLVQALTALVEKPKVLVCASAIGFYGDRGSSELTEESTAGEGFLAEVCQAWEAEAKPAADAGIRVVHLRIGVVLSADGGALAKMLPPFKLGAGGVLGSGKQYMSWIDRDDLVGIIRFAIAQEGLSGPVNAVAPVAATNREFTKTLGRVLGRPTIFPVPAPAARLAFGKMADALLLASTRVVPTKLQQAGYGYQFPDLAGSLRHQLGR
jgi:uncharacterized protein (TIGR01777 family)